MKSLLVTRKANGGIKNHLEILIEKLPRYNITPVFCGPQEDYNMADKINSYYISINDGFSILEDIKTAVRLKDIIKQITPDIVHSHGYKASFLVGLAHCMSRFPWMATIHNFQTLPSNKIFFWLFIRTIINRANLVQVVSESLKNELIALGVKKDKCRVLYNGIPLASFHKPVKSREKLSLPRGRLVGCVGRLNYDKGIDKFLHAVKYMWENYYYYLNSRKFNFLIIGDGPEEKNLKKLSWQLGIASRVYFLGYRRDAKDIMKYLELLCIPSRQEGLSMTALEAMASLCPVVAVKNGGLKELFTHKENGILVPSNNPKHLGEAVLWTLKSERIKRKISWQGYINVMDNFNAQVMLKKLINLYRGVLS